MDQKKKVKKIEKSLRKDWSMRYELVHPDEDGYHGIVIHAAEEFVVIAEFTDFQFDGFMAFPTHRIKRIRDNKYDDCLNQVIRHCGEFKRMEKPAWLFKTKSMPQLLRALVAEDIWPAIEAVDGDPPDASFYLGPITSIDADAVGILCYDAEGKWEAEYEIPYRDIVRVEFESHYCRYFNAYMREFNPPE